MVLFYPCYPTCVLKPHSVFLSWIACLPEVLRLYSQFALAIKNPAKRLGIIDCPKYLLDKYDKCADNSFRNCQTTPMVSTLGAGPLVHARGPCFFSGQNMRTYIYVDGFNFYYGAVKNTPYKWLDFKTFFEKLLDPQHKILSIKYFTAMVSGKFDPDQPVRQKTFIRAIQKHIPELSVYYGKFITHEVLKPLVYKGSKYKHIKFKVPVYKTEEKGSDVNLAVHLLNDAWNDEYDCAVVVSNDSDLAEALKLVKNDHKKIIGLINPHRYPAKKLMPHADFYKQIREGVLKDSQLPDPIPGTTLSKPSVW
jgi:uncharacterized LabA/DUF88 family protein